MSTKLSIATMNNGGIVEAIDEALELLAKNIADINTEPDKMRELTIKVQIKPDANRSFGGAKVTVVPKLQPQQARKFVFRMGSEPLTCSLIEADGGAWRLAAMESIAKWLQENLPTGVRIIA